MFSTREEFLSGAGRRYTTFQLPTSGREVRIRSLSEGEMSALEMSAFERDPLTDELRKDDRGGLIKKESSIADSRVELILVTLVDDEGKLLLSPADAELVRNLDAADILPLYLAISEHCRLPERHDEAAKKNEPTSSGTIPAEN